MSKGGIQGFIRVELRRSKVYELYSRGTSQSQISRMLEIGLGTVNRDISFFRDQAINNMRKYIDEKFPEEFSKCLTVLDSIQKETWSISAQVNDTKEKLQSLTLVLACSVEKMELLTNPAVIDNAKKYVSSQTGISPNSASNNTSNHKQSDGYTRTLGSDNSTTDIVPQENGVF
jgi:hypothetical protein